MEEFHRLVRKGGTVRIETPHYTDFSSFCDPTHKSHLNSFSFRYFGENHGGFGGYFKLRFFGVLGGGEVVGVLWWLGVLFFVDRFSPFRRLFGNNLFFFVGGGVM